jgi:hypothetical protein
MTHRYIRAMLRSATAEKYLHGWQGPHAPYRSYTMTPQAAPCVETSLAETVGYVHALESAGVQPLYRDSEPIGIYE